ncbi:hypothetical protein IWQ62_003803 [Dispira parvispora]|uniref:non-specific serine/threonine protein kinase n=1 Tax=Dispira parvispora TaxID=1520584 RepID=A0A9W8E1A6_9FUNG|nr:hypothetical protein IWQ62_003803 [Dispira parvispora]
MSATPPRAVKTYGKRGRTRLLYGQRVNSRSENLWHRMLLASPRNRTPKPDLYDVTNEPSTYFNSLVDTTGSASLESQARSTPLKENGAIDNRLDTPQVAPCDIPLSESSGSSTNLPLLDDTSPELTGRTSATVDSDGGSPQLLASSPCPTDSDDDTNTSFVHEANRAIRLQHQLVGETEDAFDLLPDPGTPRLSLLTGSRDDYCALSFASSARSDLPEEEPGVDRHLTKQLNELDLDDEQDITTTTHDSGCFGADTKPVDETPEWPGASQKSDLVPLESFELSVLLPTSVATPLDQSVTWERSSFQNIAPSDLPALTTFVTRRTVRREHLLAVCGQEEPCTFEDLLGAEFMSQATKLNESTFAEAFVGPSLTFTGQVMPNTVVKIIPFGGGIRTKINGQKQTTFRDVYQEMCTSWVLSYWPLYKSTEGEVSEWNFIRVHQLGICRGTYPLALLQRWDTWRGHYPDRCENDRPDFFPDDQLYAVFCLEHGGLSLENFVFASLAQAQSVLLQLLCTLVIAEQDLEFEHRDLHWDNIMLADTPKESVCYKFSHPTLPSQAKVATAGVRVNIIDYTLSRLQLGNSQIFHVDIIDEEIFQGTGDRQFDVYRAMRQVAHPHWSKHYPQTNVQWFVYVLDKLVNQKCTPEGNLRTLLQPAYREDPESLFEILGQAPSLTSLCSPATLGRYLNLPIDTFTPSAAAAD